EDVEEALAREPGVKEAAVIAVPTAAGGAALHAYLLPQRPVAARRDQDLAALVAQVNGRLAQHQRLASASWWPEADFPRTSTLKVRRHLLPPPTQEAVRVESVQAADDPVGRAVAAAARMPSVAPGQTLGGL